MPTFVDVSRIGEKVVRRYCAPKSLADLQACIKQARLHGLQVSACGTRHSMGGHCIAEQGMVVDMKYLDGVLALNTEEVRNFILNLIDWMIDWKVENNRGGNWYDLGKGYPGGE